tara:strand:+ start:2400 stop:3590 length:1191 start_codon:yes stop_codon:yes gene_type:complete
MKTFQKITLAAAISAAPFMSQAMEALDDTVLGNTTGQAGVTIEIDLGDNGIKVGSVVYTDTAHQVVDVNGVAPGDAGYIATTEDGGSVALENINVNLTGKLVQTIDVSENGDLEMTMSSPGDLTISMGNDAADTTGQFSALKLVGGAGNDSELINNLDLSLKLGDSTTTIKNLGGKVLALTDRTGITPGSPEETAADAADALINKNNLLATNGLGKLANAGVVGSYADDYSSMAIQMNASIEITDMNLGAFGYTEAQAGILVGGKADQYAALYANASSPEAKAALAASYGDADDSGTITGAELAALKDKIATSSAVQVEGVTVAAASGGAIELNQVIWAVGGDASLEGSKAGVYIQLGAMDMNIGVADIKIGNGSIGSLAINGLEMNGMTQRIYGH